MVYTPQTWADLPSETTPLSAARLNYIENGIADLGVWNSFTPSLSGVTLGNAGVVAGYTQIGKTVFMSVRIILGSTSAITGDVSLTLPVNAARPWADVSGTVVFADTGTANYFGAALQASATSVTIRSIATNGATAVANVVLNASTPFVWTTGDIMVVGLTYEAA